MDEALLLRFSAIVGQRNALGPDADLTRYTHENRGIVTGRTPLVLKPASTAEVAAILALANATRTPIVPQGGHTGHAGGAVPDESGTQVVLSLERMVALREFDETGNTATVEAGMTLQQMRDIADRHDRLFPVSLASEGSCQIGGNVSTNAGGIATLAYGNMREQVLGLEVVLADGSVWNGLRKLRKDNSGYALKHLFIGAEGTLGVVTAATLQLQAKPKGRELCFAGMESVDAALALFNLARDRTGNALTAFELMHRTPLEFTLRHAQGARNPLAGMHEWFVLAEFSSSRSQDDARAMAEDVFGEALANGVCSDAAVSQSFAQQAAFRKIREDMPGAQAKEGGSIKHDIAVPVQRLPEFFERAGKAVHGAMPNARVCAFGHMGDGNIHYNVSQPVGMDRAAFLARTAEINDAVHAVVLDLEGTISAEHGIGRLKRHLLAQTRSPAELAMMRALKATFDPNGILNPGKIV
jgi:FAD/FMN-containing dehydrogenase